MTGLKTAQNLRQTTIQHGSGKPNAQLARLTFGHIPSLSGGGPRLFNQGPRCRHKGQTRSGQLHAPAVAVEQLRPDRSLELLNVQAQGRLGNGQPLRRAAKMKLFREHQEISEVSEFHVFKICIAESIINIRQLFMNPQQSSFKFYFWRLK